MRLAAAVDVVGDHFFVFDTVSCSGPDQAALVVGTGEAGDLETVRVAAESVYLAAVNLRIGNAGLSDYADGADDDGVYREG